MATYTIENPRQFILAGRAFFTLQNIVTKKHLTFRVSKCDDKRMYFVSVCNSYDTFMFIGNLYANEDKTKFNFVKSKRLNDENEALSLKTFNWIKTEILENCKNFLEMEFLHFGKCSVCGRKLTTPESIKIGIGPDCITRV